MKRFSRWPVRTKLAAVASVLIGLISLAMFMDVPARLKRQATTAVVEKAHTLTEMAAFNAGAALHFEDRAGVEESLAAVRENPDLVYTVVLDEGGGVVAAFNRELAERYGFQEIAMAPRVLKGVPPRTRASPSSRFREPGNLFNAPR